MSEETIEELQVAPDPENAEVEYALEKEAESATVSEPDIPEESITASLLDINALLLQQQNRSSKIQELRDKTIDMLTPVVMGLKIDVNNKAWSAEDTSKVTSIISEFRALLNDSESSDRSVLNTRIKVKDMETNQKNSISAADFFASIKRYESNQGVVMVDIVDQSANRQRLDKMLDESGDVINESELTIGGNMLPKEEDV